MIIGGYANRGSTELPRTSTARVRGTSSELLTGRGRSRRPQLSVTSLVSYRPRIISPLNIKQIHRVPRFCPRKVLHLAAVACNFFPLAWARLTSSTKPPSPVPLGETNGQPTTDRLPPVVRLPFYCFFTVFHFAVFFLFVGFPFCGRRTLSYDHCCPVAIVNREIIWGSSFRFARPVLSSSFFFFLCSGKMEFFRRILILICFLLLVHEGRDW